MADAGSGDGQQVLFLGHPPGGRSLPSFELGGETVKAAGVLRGEENEPGAVVFALGPVLAEAVRVSAAFARGLDQPPAQKKESKYKQLLGWKESQNLAPYVHVRDPHTFIDDTGLHGLLVGAGASAKDVRALRISVAAFLAPRAVGTRVNQDQVKKFVQKDRNRAFVVGLLKEDPTLVGDFLDGAEGDGVRALVLSEAFESVDASISLLSGLVLDACGDCPPLDPRSLSSALCMYGCLGPYGGPMGWGCFLYGGTSLIRKRPPPNDHHRALGMVQR